MKGCVIDCSFFIASLMPDENVNSFNLDTQSVFVPSIFFLECSNVLLVAHKKERLDTASYEESIKALYDLPFRVDSFSSGNHSVFTISRIAQKYNLTSYDASYVELALRLGVCLGSLDKQIIRACKDLNIKTIDSELIERNGF